MEKGEKIDVITSKVFSQSQLRSFIEETSPVKKKCDINLNP